LKSPSSIKLTSGNSGKLTAPASGKYSIAGPGSGVLKAPKSGKLTAPPSAKLTKPISPDSAKIPGPTSPADHDSSSEFELSIDADSDSFEMSLNVDNSDEVALGGDAFENRGGQSGINLGNPADSGLSLEKRRQLELENDSDVDFELSLDAPGVSGTRLGGPRSAVRHVVDSDSEFELSLDDSGLSDALVDELEGEQSRGDIFETDFELPVISDEDSGSEVVAIESSDTDLDNSDFDIAIDAGDAPLEDDSSASQVMLIDDEDAAAGLLDDDSMIAVEDDEDQPQARRGGQNRGAGLLDEGYDEDADVAVEVDDDGHIGSVLTGRPGAMRHGADGEEMPMHSSYVAPPRWGILPVILLLPCVLIVMVGGMMAFEMVRGQWGYQQPVKPSDALVRGLAKQFDFKMSD